MYNFFLTRSCNVDDIIDCGYEQDSEISSQYINNIDKLRKTTKYFLGSTYVKVVYLSGPTDPWTESRKLDFYNNVIRKGRDIFKRIKHYPNGTLLPKHQFKLDNTLDESISQYPPPLGSADRHEVTRNIKQVLADKGYYSGDISVGGDIIRQNDTKQELYEYLNDLRDDNNTDWSLIVFAIAKSSTNSETAWASHSKVPSFVVIHENEKNEDWTLAHEILHAFGANDEGGSCLTSYTGGLYDIPNINCNTPASDQCIMKKRRRIEICDQSWRQLSLILTDTNEYLPQKDFSHNLYNLTKLSYFRSQVGVRLISDIIRPKRKLYISVSGKSKMHPWYNEHGPDGDSNTIVGSDHLLPNQPFSCVIGRWKSVDGSQYSDWFYVGSGNKWFTAPNYRAYFIWGINDKINNFSDNSGNMDVHLYAALPDQCGRIYQDSSLSKSSTEIPDLEALKSKIGKLLPAS